MCTYKKIRDITVTTGKRDLQAVPSFNLLSKKNFASGTDALTCLSRTLVGTRLKTNHSLTSSQLFLCKITFAFV